MTTRRLPAIGSGYHPSAYCPNCHAPYRLELPVCPECQHLHSLRPTQISPEAIELHDMGRCGVLVVRRRSTGQVLEDHSRRWNLPRNELAAELNECRNFWVEKAAALGPDHPDHADCLSLIKGMESVRVQVRELGL
ncbi:hypothetical protein [Deinococcus marmoris]|uniref:hypothetical protein n=1 Tax=Deinococcus marmoris TaxID=249408 RepID=UPI0012DFCAA4|nr:hypothetical protein [Deinococcus marmoris]